MARTAVFSFCIGLLFSWNWARLEEPRAGIGPMLLMIVLGVAPALLPTLRWRLAGAGAALIVAGAIALDVARPWSIDRIASRAGRGFLDFYDVLVPFDGAAHPLMHGVILLAVFLFTALTALAVAARRPLLAGLLLVAGAGWPATIMPGDDDLGRGAFILAAVLALVAWLRPEGRRAPPQVLVGIGIVVVALVLSSSGAVAKGQFVSWENWDFYNKPGKPVEVSYVWRANYDGIDFPKERTRVFTVSAPARSTYWRATTLDAFANDRWDEDLVPLASDLPSPVELTDDPLLPASARKDSEWTRADVTIDALRDSHLVGPSQPVAYDTKEIESVQYERGGVARAAKYLPRGAEYTAWGYAPQPSPAKLAKSPAIYPSEIELDGRYLGLPHGGAVPPFGSSEHALWASAYFRESDEGRRYRPLYERAVALAGNANNPYAAAVALEAWFRSAGRFVYDEHPPPGTRGSATRSVRDQDETRLLPALRRRDGADAALPRDSFAGGRRLRERLVRRGAQAVDGLRPRRAHVGRGLVQRVRLAPVRPDSGPRDARRSVYDLVDAIRRERGDRRARGKRPFGRVAGLGAGHARPGGADAEHAGQRCDGDRPRCGAGRPAAEWHSRPRLAAGARRRASLRARQARRSPEPVSHEGPAADRGRVPEGARRVPPRPADRCPGERRHA